MKHILLVFLIGIIYCSAYSQSPPPDPLPPLDHYVLPEFVQGVVLMKNGVRNEALLNYNSVSEEMIFEKNGTKLALGGAELGRVDTVYLKNKKFFILYNKFVELAYQSINNELYVEHKCKIEEPGKSVGYGGTSNTTPVVTHSSYYAQSGGIYNLQLPEGYTTVPYLFYYLKQGNRLSKFTNLKQLKKLYKNKSDIFNEYVKENNIKYENQDDVIRLIKYLEII